MIPYFHHFISVPMHFCVDYIGTEMAALILVLKVPMPTVIRVPMLITFLTNSHAYGYLGAYTYSEGKSTYLVHELAFFYAVCNLFSF